MIIQLKNLFKIVGEWFMWLAPVSVFLLALIIPTKLFKLDFLKFIDILAWPITILTASFFFKKVFTYLLFSIDEFNFFGLKGHLRNVNDVILDEVNKKFIEKEKEEIRKLDTKKLNLEIGKKEDELNKMKDNAQDNLNFAKEVIKDWKETTKNKDKIIKDLEIENKRINEILSSISPQFIPSVSSPVLFDEAKTSGPILEETNNQN
jgi:hypothetical protein